MTSIVSSTPVPSSPQLMIVLRKGLTSELRNRLTDLLDEVRRDGKPFVIDFEAAVYQLVDGEWKPVHPPASQPVPELTR